MIAQARKVRAVMESTGNVVDVDDSFQAEQVQYNFIVDRTKAGLHGITEEDVVRSARIFLGGESPTIVHSDTERTPLEINLRLPRDLRSRPEDMGPIRVKAADDSMVPFNELGALQETVVDQTIFRKNLERLVFVTAEMAGRSPVNAIFDLQAAMEKSPLLRGFSVKWAGEGEWKITLEIFRDLGLAFAGALILIYKIGRAHV